ncbi:MULTISPECIES: helix-turn-helix domain-containing protein [Streptococcus]|uniref:helix-turn-helix domain-containing protein n=1 Tax=Streptococcus TaxID=1301 RepID=UPI002948F531|nr:helix-turn-helix domain-containing protein [Streptococcus canis]MDV5972711.1 helix-turn-helix domain-containing protein [Streptococcus canis]
MISYKPFYNTLLEKDITEYYLIKIEGISANTLHRIKKGESITTKTIDKLCEVLECRVEDIIEFQYDNK